MNQALWGGVLFALAAVVSFPALLSAEPSLEVPSPPVPMGSPAYLDARNGFRDAKFGSPLSSFKGMMLKEQGSGMKYYVRNGDDLTIGKGKLSVLSYGFYKNQLSIIIMVMAGGQNSRAILSVFQEAYGSGFKSNQFLEDYYWPGKKVTALYSERLATKDATMVISDTALENQWQAEEKGKTKKAASGL